MNPLRTFLILILGAVLPAGGWAADGVGVADENALKVAFIVNFTKFVSWPEDRSDSPEGLVTVAVWDYEALKLVFDGYGEEALRKQKVRFVPYNPECKERFDVLYVNTTVRESVIQGLRCAARTGPVLTVGEFDRFPDLGGMINFVPRRDTIGFELNLNAIQSQSLSVSSHLIRLGTIVNGSAPSTGLIQGDNLSLVAMIGLLNVRR